MSATRSLHRFYLTVHVNSVADGVGGAVIGEKGDDVRTEVGDRLEIEGTGRPDTDHFWSGRNALVDACKRMLCVFDSKRYFPNGSLKQS